MHPRRHGAYSFAARAASAYVNTYYKYKKQQQKYGNTNTNTDQQIDSTSWTAGIIVFIIFIILCALIN